MIDHVTLGIKGEDAAIVRRQPGLKWNREFIEDTAELSTQANGKFGPMKISYLGPRFVVIKGSLHQLWNDLRGHGKVNWDQFGFAELWSAIGKLTQAIGLPASRVFLHGIEFGLNLEDPPFGVIETIQAMMLHQGTPFIPYESGMGRFAKYTQYRLKAYHKGLQSGIDREILRFEMKVKRMQKLQALRIETLADLQDADKLPALIDMLLSHFKQVTFHDPGIMPEYFRKAADRQFWKDTGYLEYWKMLDAKTKSRKRMKLERTTQKMLQHPLKALFTEQANQVFRERMNWGEFYT